MLVSLVTPPTYKVLSPGPEVDDLEGGMKPPSDAAPYPGIDDGLLENGGFKPIHPPGEGKMTQSGLLYVLGVGFGILLFIIKVTK